MTVLAPSVTLTATSTVISSTVIDSVDIEYGRKSPSEHCVASTATINLLNPISANIDLGVELTVSAGANVRFRGLIDSISAGPYTTTITAVAQPLAVWAIIYGAKGFYFPASPSLTQSDIMVGATLWVQYQATVDPTSLPTVTGSYTDTVTVNCGTYPYGVTFDGSGLLASGGFTGSALEFLHAFADMDGTAYWYESVGVNQLNAADGRFRATTDAFTLTGSDINKDWSMVKSKANLNNYVEVGYYNTALTSTGVFRSKDSASQTAYGPSGVSVQSVYGDVALAQRSSLVKMAGRNTPRYTLDGLTVDVRRTSAGTTTSLMAAYCGTRVGTPLSAYIPNCPTSMYIEGWHETITNSSHYMRLYLSDVLLSQPLEQWLSVNPATQYAGLSGTLKWQDLLTTTI